MMTFFEGKPSRQSEGLSLCFHSQAWKHRTEALQHVAAGLVSVRWWEEPAFLQTSEVELKAKRSILLSSEQRMFFLTVWEFFRSLFHRRLLLRRSFCLLTTWFWGSDSVSNDLLELSPICTSANLKGLGNSEPWSGPCSEHDDFISFPGFVPLSSEGHSSDLAL